VKLCAEKVTDASKNLATRVVETFIERKKSTVKDNMALIIIDLGFIRANAAKLIPAEPEESKKVNGVINSTSTGAKGKKMDFNFGDDAAEEPPKVVKPAEPKSRAAADAPAKTAPTKPGGAPAFTFDE
jgi:hypothetical protein